MSQSQKQSEDFSELFKKVDALPLTIVYFAGIWVTTSLGVYLAHFSKFGLIFPVLWFFLVQ